MKIKKYEIIISTYTSYYYIEDKWATRKRIHLQQKWIIYIKSEL